MVDGNILANSAVTQSLMGIGTQLVWWLVAAIFLVFVGVIGYFSIKAMRMAKKYKEYLVLYFRRMKDDSGNSVPIFCGTDRLAIIKDKKTKKWIGHLKKWNLDIGEEEGAESADENRQLDFPSIPSESGAKVLFIEKLGPRKCAIGQPVWFDGMVKVLISEADSAEAMRAYDTNAKFYTNDKTLLYTFLTYAGFAALILVLIIYLVNKFEVLKDVAQSLDHAAQILDTYRSSGFASTTPG